MCMGPSWALAQPVSAVWGVQMRISYRRKERGQQMKNREGTKSHGEEYTEGAKDETGKKVQRGSGSKYRIAVHANTVITMFE